MSSRKNYSNKNDPPTRRGIPFLSALPLGVPAGVAIIFVAAFLAYFPSLNGDFLLDDDIYVSNSDLIRAPDGLYWFWFTTKPCDYWPVSNSTFWFEWRIWGMNSTGYHVTNLILHILDALLIWIVLRKLSIPGAFLAALIFAVHPVNVASVAWIAQRKNVTAMLFFLLSILCYLKLEIPLGPLKSGLDRSDLPLVPRRRRLWYWLSFATFVLAMLSKGSVASLPVLLLGISWWLRPLRKRDFVRIAPFLLVAVALAIVNVWFQLHGSDRVIRTDGFVERLLGAAGAVWFYLYKALFPFDLAFVYSQWHVEAAKPLWWFPLLTAMVTTFLLWRYKGSWSRPFLFAWAYFCVALLPVLGFADAGFMRFSLVADHYQYIAIIGVIALAAAGWSIWHKRTQGGTRWAAAAFAVVVVGTLTFLTWRQNGIFHNATTLFQATLEKNPDCWMAHNNLGSVLVLANRPKEAIEHCRQALRLKPNYSEAHYNLGNALVQTGRRQEAIEQYREAVALKAYYPEAENNLANLLIQSGRTQEAIDHYQQALRLKPHYVSACYNLGGALLKTGRPREAIEYFKQVLQLRPDHLGAYNDLTMTYAQTNQPAEAIATARKAMEVARSQGKMDLARQIEDWLNAYQEQGPKD